MIRSAAVLVGLYMLGGCHKLFDLVPVVGSQDGEIGTLDDMPGDCSAVAFPMIPTQELSELTSVAGDPMISEDELEIFFTKPSTFGVSIYRATRMTLADAFVVEPTPAPFNRAAPNADPSMTRDGRELMFVSGGDRAYFVTRNTSGSWSSPAPVPGLETVPVSSLSLALDGLTLYYESPDNSLWQTGRSTRSASFGAPTLVIASDAEYPGISGDGKQVFYTSSDNGLWQATRSTTTEPFGPPSLVLGYGKDPQLTADSRKLLFANADSISILERDCP